MIAGHFKHKIGYADKCMLTVPTVVIGGNYRIHSLAAGERLECWVQYEANRWGWRWISVTRSQRYSLVQKFLSQYLARKYLARTVWMQTSEPTAECA